MAQYQNIILTLRDGRVITASVPAFTTEEDAATLGVKSIGVTPPRGLPPGVSFEDIAPEPKHKAEVVSIKR